MWMYYSQRRWWVYVVFVCVKGWTMSLEKTLFSALYVRLLPGHVSLWHISEMHHLPVSKPALWVIHLCTYKPPRQGSESSQLCTSQGAQLRKHSLNLTSSANSHSLIHLLTDRTVLGFLEDGLLVSGCCHFGRYSLHDVIDSDGKTGSVCGSHGKCCSPAG